MLRIDFGNAAFLQYERSHGICLRERPVKAVALGDSARGGGAAQEREGHRLVFLLEPELCFPLVLSETVLFW